MLADLVAYNRPEAHYAWRGHSILILDSEGRIGTGNFQGFFFRQMRYLSELRLEVDGEEPFLSSLGQAGPHEITLAYVYPPVPGGAGQGGSGERHEVLYRDLDLDLRYRVRSASLEATLRIASRWQRAEFDLGWLVAADFAEKTEAMGQEAKLDAPVEEEPLENGVSFRLQHEEAPLQTHISVEGGGGWRYARGRLSTRLSLDRQQSAEIRLVVRAVDSHDAIDEEGEERRERRLQEWLRSVTRVHAPGETPLVGITNLSVSDLGSLALLEGSEEEWLAPAAGVPLYPSFWGRDALTAAWQAAVFDRGAMAEAALAVCGRTQGTKVDERRDEEPGRIVRQIKRSLPARLGKNPYDRYYADYSSPFMFILAMGNAYAWSGDKQLLERHWDAARRVLDWAREYGDRDGDGYLEYRTHYPKGPIHQGWKDADNAIVYEDGSQVEPPIAPSEIQGYYFAALQFMAVFSVIMGERQTALDLWGQARKLKKRFNRDFWMEEHGIVGLGLDPEKRLIESVASNAGQCLTTGIIEDEKLPRVVRRLFEPDMFSGWGIRTLSAKNPAYDPLAYHLGSVWSVENGTILFGLRRFGFDDRAVELARALYDLSRVWSDFRIPECVGGYARDERPLPAAYPRANAPQTWNQSVFPILVQSLLGMRPVGALSLLALDPVLPPWLPEVTMKNLRVADATVTLRFWRDEEGKSHYEVVEQTGTLRIVNQPPLDALNVGLWDRLGALAEGVLPFGRPGA